MTNSMNWNGIVPSLSGTPAEIRDILKSAYLTKKIASDLNKGISPADILERYLPGADRDACEENARELTNGVTSVFNSLNNDESASDIICNAISGMSNHDAALYLAGIMNLAPKNSVNNETAEQIKHITSLNSPSDEDIDELKKYAIDAFEDTAAKLARTSVAAMGTCIGKMNPDTVIDVSEYDETHALANALATYIMIRCGEAPKGFGDAKEMKPYEIGCICAANTENSRLMALHLKTKSGLDALETSIANVIKKAMAFIIQHLAGLISAPLYLWLSCQLFAIISSVFIAFGAGPLVIILGTWLIGFPLLYHCLTYSVVYDAVNDLIEVIKSLFGGGDPDTGDGCDDVDNDNLDDKNDSDDTDDDTAIIPTV